MLDATVVKKNTFTNTLKLIDEEIISFTFWLIEGVNTWPIEQHILDQGINSKRYAGL